MKTIIIAAVVNEDLMHTYRAGSPVFEVIESPHTPSAEPNKATAVYPKAYSRLTMKEITKLYPKIHLYMLHIAQNFWVDLRTGDLIRLDKPSQVK